jgi:Cytochrome oxidase c subunit VIb
LLSFCTDVIAKLELTNSDFPYYIHSKEMGWIPSWLGGSTEKGSDSAKSVSQPPDRASRVKCWDARDKFFGCLDKNDIIDSVEEDTKARKQCPSEFQEFEKECIASWVSSSRIRIALLLGYYAPIFNES